MPKIVVGGKVSPDLYGAKTGPRGQKGNTGDIGPKGDKGDDGAGMTAWVETFNPPGTLQSVVAATDVVLNDNTLYYKQDEDKNHSLGWGYTTHGIDGPVLNGFSGVGMAVGNANTGNDTLVANFSSTGLQLPPLSHGDYFKTKLATIDYSGKVVAEDKPEDITFYYTSQDTWIVNHNLNKRPNIDVYSVGGKEMLAEIIHTSLNQVIVYFDEPLSGSVIVSQ